MANILEEVWGAGVAILLTVQKHAFLIIFLVEHLRDKRWDKKSINLGYGNRLYGLQEIGCSNDTYIETINEEVQSAWN